MDIICSDLLHSTGLVACGITTRHGGVSPEPFRMNLSFSVGDSKENVEQNRELFAQALGTRVDRWAVPEQVHGNVVKHARSAGSYPSCDGLVTDTVGIYLCVSIADCVPIFLLETQRQAIAAMHAGWRGTAASIAQLGVKTLVKEFQCRPEHMLAYVGPGAAACCYEVGEDVAGRFSREFVREEKGKLFVDLKAATVSQLLAAGVSRDMIEVSPHCTIGEANVFHSYRRDRERSGRMMGVIGLKTSPVR